MNAKQVIVNLVRREYDRALEEYKKAIAERAGCIASANAWNEFNKDDGIGGISMNPYNLNAADQKEERARVFVGQMKQAYELAVDTFLANS